MDAHALELRDQFYQLLDENTSSRDLWRDVWRLFVEHPWYQEELRLATFRLLRRKGAPLRWAEDIAQDATLLFGEHLRKAADLDVDRARAAQHFSGWLSRIIARDCQRALRGMLRCELRVKVDVRPVDAAPAKVAGIDEIIDLSMVIDKLPADCRDVVRLRSQGWRVCDIAAELQISLAHAYRALNSGHSLLTDRWFG